MILSTQMIIVIAVAVALFVAVLVILRARVQAGSAPYNPYIEALRLLIDGDRTLAFERLQQAVKSGSAPVDAYVRLGRMLREKGEASKALQIHKSLTVKSDLTRAEKTEVYFNIAEDYSQLGKPEQAVATLEGALRTLDLKGTPVYRILARESHALGRTEAAYDYLRELKRTGAVGNRELALYLVTASEEDAKAGKTREARRTLHRALKRDPHCAPALLALGNLEEAAGHVDHSIARWHEAARWSRELAPAALRQLERVLFQRGTFGEIEAVYKDVLETRPDDENTTLALAAFYRKQGRSQDAVSLLEELLGEEPRSIGGAMLLTSMYAAQGDTSSLATILDDVEDKYAKHHHFRCGVCSNDSDRMLWHCPRCNSFDSYASNSA